MGEAVRWHGADSYLRGGAGPVRPDRGPDPDGEDQRVLRLKRRDVVIIYYRGLMRPAVRRHCRGSASLLTKPCSLCGATLLCSLGADGQNFVERGVVRWADCSSDFGAACV